MDINLLEIELRTIECQKEICLKYGAEFSPAPFGKLIGVALESFNSSEILVNGLRHPDENKNVINWYIWNGEYSLADDFFQSIHIHHLLKMCPKAINYLGLSQGWRFLFDGNGYEDVWFDESLLLI